MSTKYIHAPDTKRRMAKLLGAIGDAELSANELKWLNLVTNTQFDYWIDTLASIIRKSREATK